MSELKGFINTLAGGFVEYSCETLAVLKMNHFPCRIRLDGDYCFLISEIPQLGLSIDGTEYRLLKNCVFPVNPCQSAEFYLNGCDGSPVGTPKLVLVLAGGEKTIELAKAVSGKTGVLFSNENNPAGSFLFELLRKFTAEAKGRKTGYNYVLERITEQIIIHFLRNIRSNLMDFPEQKKYTTRDDINSVIDFLWENTDFRFTLDKLCSYANLSPYYFMRLFKETTGKTPYEYYMDIKINRAVEYLRSGEYSITEIGHKLGFANHSHFSSVFRKKTGMSPSQFK